MPFLHSQEKNIDALQAKLWEKDSNGFKIRCIAALALLNMTMHARPGGNTEVMGWMLG